MQPPFTSPIPWVSPQLPGQAYAYWLDGWQRAVLFTDLLRRRGNQYIAHVKAGQPPVLVFAYEMVVDGRTLDRPVNHAIVRIINRRSRPAVAIKNSGERRSDETGQHPEALDPRKRPIVVIDPRAGQGPGIGGSKLDSQIGVALNAGHPVYFVLFYPEPEPGQTLADVEQAEIRFLEEVIRLHPQAEPPAVIGNCQAGWATALIGADRPDVTGPMVLNGSPLSYWGGVDGASPMRYRAGLLGGTWLTSLLCDLGCGTFDGAHLVANFEQLNPANTLWVKHYSLWSGVDDQERRYLDFEKWWGGFFAMNREEIHFIVESLFVGNELEQGHLRLGRDRWINLKNFKDPIVVFASNADRITPPQQALGWISKVYKTVDEIKRNGQIIVYILHEKIGHLGIFVGASVARKEHTAIIGTVDMIEYLSPGLYEMVIIGKEGENAEDARIEFIERTMEDLLAMDDGRNDELPFAPVAAVSRFNDKAYLRLVSPYVRCLCTPAGAELLRQLHPLRVERYSLSDLNPFLWPCHFLAPRVREQRRPVAGDNPFVLWERAAAGLIEDSLNLFRDLRDQLQHDLFQMLYNNEWMHTLFPAAEQTAPAGSAGRGEQEEEIEHRLWQEVMRKGDFAAAAVRIILAMASADGTIDRLELQKAQEILLTNEQTRLLSPTEMKRLIREQAGILAHDRASALAALPDLLPDPRHRAAAMAIAWLMADADNSLHAGEQEVLETIRSLLTPADEG